MPGPVFLDGDAVTLRPVERGDVEFVQRAMNDPAIWRPALDVDPTNGDQAEAFHETVLSGDEGVHCLVTAEGNRVGMVTLATSRYGPDETARARSAELAYWVAPDSQGQGYGSDAAGRMVRYAFEDRNLRRLDARVGAFNEASAALLESLGFEHEGTRREAAWYRGGYHDMLQYGLLRSAWDG